MDSMKMRVFMGIVVVLMATSAVQNVAAADSPAPSPTSDATVFVPTMFASLAPLVFGLLY
ncbi:arabinogalactan peptide 13-like [Tripterygium wilfordii]|uniref:Arabinogalactan peptide 13-like n=1 Tax=Tripterygium wilfordii TaxID=458696 RepID=A0A7J7CM45_TRIWF|nr:arabinogalactan peptide 13-like [Tripterygium wilfordii]